MSLARYSFLPWLRRGLSSQLAVAAESTSRAALDVTVTVASELTSEALPPRRLQLVGPGDIVGFNPQVVVRTEPRSWVTDFEPNYLAFVEFYDEDFAWRYTPAPPDGATHRLTPWISLLVLKEGEFSRVSMPSRPLISVTLEGIDPSVALPPDDQVWAWAHVHVNADLGSSSTPDAAALASTLRADPDRGICRLLSPRRLEPNTPYHAFVIPTFEAGRKAGLGEEVRDADSGLALAWAAATEFPVYFEWFFRTGAAGDFEELVRALVPRPLDGRVGVRDLDVQQPGFILPPITSPPDDVVGLEGALLSPTSVPKPLATTSNFPAEIETAVNLAADVESAGASGGDPVVTAPLYGRWHALVTRMSSDPALRSWVNEINSDPRFRSAAGLGARVVQEGQETYMRLAWEQIGEVLAANRRIHFTQVAVQACQQAFDKSVAVLPDAHVLSLAAPVLKRVKGGSTTVHHQVTDSRLPRATLSGAFRKQLRPRGALGRRLAARGARAPIERAVDQLNAGTISPAPPRPAPNAPTLEQVAAIDRPAPPLGADDRHGIVARVAAIATRAIDRWLGPGAAGTDTGDAFRSEALTPQAAVAVPPVPGFVLAPPGRTPTVPPGSGPPGGSGPDSPDAREFRRALIAFHQQLAARSPPSAPREEVPLAEMRATVLHAVEPARAFPRRLGAALRIGGQPLSAYLSDSYRDSGSVGVPPTERIVTVMAYPDVKLPMYEPLRDISSELLVPNLRLVEPNTISLMMKNQPFIEAYLVGLNHEFARELLWREYPTDQRPSTFRQFWDVSSSANTGGADPEAFEESLRDIQRIHEWPRSSRLGEHDNRRKPGDPPEGPETPLAKRQVVLVVRGELLKKYPNTIIYAQRARWGDRPDNALRLVLWDETGEKALANPADPNIRLPLYKASVAPDIYFVGFDLTVEEVIGHAALDETAAAKAAIPATELGWFFVLEEVIGEPRFGLDENPPGVPGELKWDNLAWDHLGDVSRIDLAQPFVTEPGGTRTDGVGWGANAADLAFILYQKPVLVAIHAREMLARLT